MTFLSNSDTKQHCYSCIKKGKPKLLAAIGHFPKACLILLDCINYVAFKMVNKCNRKQLAVKRQGTAKSQQTETCYRFK